MYRLDPSRTLKKNRFLDNRNRNSSVLHIIYVTVSRTDNISDFISQGLHFQKKCAWYSSTSCFYRLTLKTSTQYINYTVLSYRTIFLERLTAKNRSACSHPKEYFCSSSFFSDAFSSLVMHRTHCSTKPE